MLLWIHDRLRKDDKGFTLIELMVVVLIIAILIAIAIPTFLGARKRAQDRQAQSNLRNGLTSQKTYYADAQGYTTDTTQMSAIETNLAWSVGATADAAARGVAIVTVSGGTTSDQVVVMASLSKSGTLFCIADAAQNVTSSTPNITAAGTYYYKNTAAGGACSTTGTDWKATTSLGW